MFLSFFHRKIWAKFHFGTFKPNKKFFFGKSLPKKVRFQGWLKMAQFLLTEFSGLPTLGSIILDISSSILEIPVLCLAANFLNFSKHPTQFLLEWFWRSYGQKPQKSEIRKYAILSQPRNLTFFEDEIFQLFSYLYGSKVQKWNFAHILLWKRAKNIRKTPKNNWYSAPWLKSSLLNDTVCQL